MSEQASGGWFYKNRHTLYIVASIILAFVVAYIWPHFAASTEVGGEVFLRLLKMVVVPLVMTSVMGGILGMGDVRKLGKPGLYTVLYYVGTTVFAVVIGLVVVNLFQPGVGAVDQATLQKLDATAGPEAAEGTPTVGAIIENLVLMLFTDNLFLAAVETQLLPLIVFSIIFAGMLTTMGEKVDNITSLINQANHALMGFVLLLMKVAPFGIFCLVASRFGEARAEGQLAATLSQTGWYSLSILTGLAIHSMITLPCIYWIVKRRNPYKYMLQMGEAILTAFSTASSSATLPVTMECSENAGVSKRSTDFVLPLGATINMDGTALYEAGAAIFIAQVIGMDLSIMQQLIIAVTATLAAIGAAGIPEAGLVTMLIVLNAVGLPVQYVGLILSVDWLLDRFRTATNTWGDSVGAAIIEGSMPKET